MDETQIAADLAAAIETPPEVPTAPDLPPQPSQGETDQNFLNKMTPEEQLTMGKLMDYFQVSVTDRNSPQVQDYMNTVYAWARDTAGSGDVYELLRVINEQEMHMGIKLKDARLNKLGEHVKIQKIRQQLANREKLLYG